VLPDDFEQPKPIMAKDKTTMSVQVMPVFFEKTVFIEITFSLS
jgi:hypothetical protein